MHWPLVASGRVDQRDAIVVPINTPVNVLGRVGRFIMCPFMHDGQWISVHDLATTVRSINLLSKMF